MSFSARGGPTGVTTYFVVGATVTRADVPVLCADLAARLRDGASRAPGACDAGAGAGDVVVCDVGEAPPSVVTIEALVRLRQTAQRYSCRLVVSGAGPYLWALVVLLGLGDVLPESGREPVQREEPLGVEEVVDRGDPPG